MSFSRYLMNNLAPRDYKTRHFIWLYIKRQRYSRKKKEDRYNGNIVGTRCWSWTIRNWECDRWHKGSAKILHQAEEAEMLRENSSQIVPVWNTEESSAIQRQDDAKVQRRMRRKGRIDIMNGYLVNPSHNFTCILVKEKILMEKFSLKVEKRDSICQDIRELHYKFS